MNAGAIYVAAAVLVVVGAFLLIIGIRSLRRLKSGFDSALIADMSCAEHAKMFQLPVGGEYGLWVSGPNLRLNAALIDRGPQVRAAAGGAPLRLTGSVFRPHMNTFRNATTKWASFSAPQGTYVLELVPGAAGTRPAGIGGLTLPIERAVFRKLPWPAAAPSDCRLQIRSHDRTSLGIWNIFKGVLPILLGAFLVIGGIIGGALIPLLS